MGILNLVVAMKGATQSILKALSLALGGKETFLSALHDNWETSFFRMLYYAQDDTHDEPGMLLHPHTDYKTLAVGFQDENGGLEVWDKTAKERFSFYMFVGPRYEQVVDPRAFGVEDADAKYPATQFMDFYNEQLKSLFGAEERNDDHIYGDADALKDMDEQLDVRG